MGTTVVVAVASRERILISHIGDSRAYKISANGVDQLTEDHSLVNELVKRGQLSREEADQHPRRNGADPGSRHGRERDDRYV